MSSHSNLWSADEYCASFQGHTLTNRTMRFRRSLHSQRQRCEKRNLLCTISCEYLLQLRMKFIKLDNWLDDRLFYLITFFVKWINNDAIITVIFSDTFLILMINWEQVWAALLFNKLFTFKFLLLFFLLFLLLLL